MSSTSRTEAQKIAARLNGARSKGPITPEGKARVAQNAVKLGLHAKRVVMANEKQDRWDDFLDALHDEWQPETLTEIELIHDLASARWRLCRINVYETRLMDLEVNKSCQAFLEFCPQGNTETLNAVCWQALCKDGTLPAIHRQEARLHRIAKDSMKQLMEIKALRLKTEAAEAAAAQPPEPAKQPKLQNKPEPAAASHLILQNKPEPSPLNRPHPAAKGPERIPPGPKAA